MGQPHKHRDVIIAWANGAEIEWRHGNDGAWQEKTSSEWFLENEYRIKPKIVKREGWIGIYDDSVSSGSIYRTQKECESNCPSACITIRIEWEEEV